MLFGFFVLVVVVGASRATTSLQVVLWVELWFWVVFWALFGCSC